MPGFKDFLKKAKELAEKGVEMVKEQMALEALMRDFDEIVANNIVEILTKTGLYSGVGQEEVGDKYVVKLAINKDDKVKPHIDRDILRKYSPKDREKIINVVPDMLTVSVVFTRKGSPSSKILAPVTSDDVTVDIDLSYFVEKKGGFLSKVKRDQRKIQLGRFSFKSTDFIDYDAKTIDKEKLTEYLESKFKGFGLI